MRPATKSSPTPLSGSGIQPDELEIGFVSGVFGIRGEVRLHVHNRESPMLGTPRDVVLVHKDGRRVGVHLTTRSGAGKRILGRIEGLDDPETAASYKDWTMVVPRDILPRPEEDEFYLVEVEGLPAVVDDVEVGRIVRIHTTGPVDVFEIAVEGDSVFVPSVKELVLAVDVEGGRVVFAPEAFGD